jgi:hypothetical protein
VLYEGGRALSRYLTECSSTSLSFPFLLPLLSSATERHHQFLTSSVPFTVSGPRLGLFLELQSISHVDSFHCSGSMLGEVSHSFFVCRFPRWRKNMNPLSPLEANSLEWR